MNGISKIIYKKQLILCKIEAYETGFFSKLINKMRKLIYKAVL